MKRPAFLIAVSLAVGILCGPPLGSRWPHSLAVCIAGTFALLIVGFSLTVTRCETPAWIAALSAWCLLGAAAAIIQPLATPRNHVTRLTAEVKVDFSQTLRWRGRLRADPLRLPWGLRYVIDLNGVQTEGQWTPTSGGLRANYYFDERQSQQPLELRAGDSVEVLLRADSVRNFGDPGAFDYETYLASQNIYLTATLRNAALIEKIPGPPPSWVQRMARLRGRLLRETDDLLSQTPARAAVARAMLLGDRSFLDSDQVAAFQQTGAYHVLVLAGLHVGVLVFALLWLSRKLRLSTTAGTIAVIISLGAYVMLVEDRPPILRAALMATAYLLARLLYRRTDLLNAMGVAAIAILLYRPSQLTDASFLLSFLAAATIGGIAAPILEDSTEKYLRGLSHITDVTRDAAHSPRIIQFRLDLRTVSNWLASHLPARFSRLAPAAVVTPCRIALRIVELTVLSVLIQTGLLPLMAYYFHRISIVSPAANLPAVLLTGLIVPYGFATLVLGTAWPALGRFLGYGLSALIGALITAIHAWAHPSWASYRVPSPPLLLMLLFFSVAAALSFTLLMKKRVWAYAACATLFPLGAILAIYPFGPRLTSGKLEITVLDVGQGDSIFVAFPNGRTMLVDGGGLPGGFFTHGARAGLDVGEDVVSPYLWTRGLKKLDVVVLTHAHEDHMGGLSAVLRNFRVGELWVGREVDSRSYRGLLAAAQARNIPVTRHSKGETYNWGGVNLGILWPPDDNVVKTASNDDSIVLRLDDGREALLLAGDIERSSEQSLTRDNLKGVEFLKVPHHGSRTSSTDTFLMALSPRYAAISVGTNNPFGHPSTETLNRIAVDGAELYRTDRDGAITALTDGHTLAIRSFRNNLTTPTTTKHVAYGDNVP